MEVTLGKGARTHKAGEPQGPDQALCLAGAAQSGLEAQDNPVPL